MIEEKVDIKPMSINSCYQGKRFSTKQHKKFQFDMARLLPKRKISQPPYKIYFEFGVSSKLADWDNYIKSAQDVLQIKYGFNDREILEGHVKKVYVKKGEEYIRFRLESIT